MGPAYHPEWLVTFWLTTAGLNWLNPHYLLIILTAGMIVRHYMKKKNAPEVEIPDTEDQRFKHLLLRKNVIEEQMGGLDKKLKAAEINEEDFSKKMKDYHTHLEQVKKELQQYTI